MSSICVNCVLVCLFCGIFAVSPENFAPKQDSIAHEHEHDYDIDEKLQNLGNSVSNSATKSGNDLVDTPNNEEISKQNERIIQQLEEKFRHSAMARDGFMAFNNSPNVFHGFLKGLYDTISNPDSYTAALSALLPTSSINSQAPEERSQILVSERKDAKALNVLATEDSTKNATDIYGEVDTCSQDVAPGVCRAYLQRWYFNTSDNTCRKFTYGGCHGNRNNFESEYECYATCTGEIPCKIDPKKVCFINKTPCSNPPISCPAYPQAICTVQPCTCKAIFKDGDGQLLNCSGTTEQTDLDRAGSIAEQDEILCPENPDRICRVSTSECVNATCPADPNAKCIVLPCVCTAVFVDHTEIGIDCNASASNSTDPDGFIITSVEKSCSNLTIGIVTFILLVVFIIILSIGISRRCKTAGSYAMFSSSFSNLAEKESFRETFTEFSVRKNSRETLV
ncbi:hypothetical protein SK128_009055 [Halocaridina rubra]|uniref:BPTI/Kunitz inhibitor domain-containing protein n=1 Tax=Halocaridina rubra TaxID=373956 RepID=A0AAN9ABQ1_HALRR